MSRPLAIPLAALVALAGALDATSARADDATCKPVSEAMAKLASTPYHETAVVNGKPFEKIYTTTALYIGSGGRWMKTPATPQTLNDASRESGLSFSNCKSLRTEAVDGQAATVYAAHSQTTTPAFGSDAQIWIGANGLPLRSESDVPTGPGKGHTSTRMAYDNVHAPAGVN